MTPLATLLQRLRPLGLTVEGIARLAGYRSATSIRQMLAGRQATPPDLLAWLDDLAAWADANPLKPPAAPRQ